MDEQKPAQTPRPSPKKALETDKTPVQIPICPTCKKPFTQCQCSHNDLKK